MKTQEVKYMQIGELIPYDKNPRINDGAVEKVAESIKQFGFKVPIVVDKNNVIITGHTRLKACQQLGINEVPVIVAADLSEKQVKAFRLADNRVAEEAEWDMDLLLEEVKELDGMFTGFNDDEFDDLMKGEEENPYTDKNIAPQYQITGESPSINKLVDTTKADILADEIEESDLSREEKEFLLLAARRHYVFDYANIAEYYANASEEMQSLMERSALVIIDYDDAILNGYVTLNKEITDMVEGEED